MDRHRKEPPKIILLGDYNFPNIVWDEISVHPAPQQGGSFVKLLDCFSVEQLVAENTRVTPTSSSLLDLILTNFPDKISDVCVDLPLSDHNIVSFILKLNTNYQNITTRKIFEYNKANYTQIRAELNDFSRTFEIFHVSKSVEECWTIFRDKIHKIVNKYVPVKQMKSFKKHWLTKQDKHLINKRNKLARQCKLSGSQEDRSKFCKYRNFVTNKLRNSHRNFVNRLIEKVPNNPKCFYRYVKSKRNGDSDIPILQDGVKSITEPGPKANLLNKYFASVFNKTKSKTEHLSNRNSTAVAMEDLQITEMGVLNLLSKIDVRKSIGPDEIPSRILVEARNEVAPILTILFRKSLTSGSLPTDWVKANVHPLFKKGVKTSPENYRPISLTCICCKLMEHILHSHISKHLSKMHILNPNQHGFLKNRSCTTQLISALNDWCSYIDKKTPAVLAVFDFAKAFDSVPHDLLLAKLPIYGIQGNVLRWISGFLVHRKQRVVLDGMPSEWLPVDSGVPQGSVLGPLLFLLYINDISENISSTVRLFADDLIMYRTISNKYSQNEFQRDINKLKLWALNWGMEFNSKKCHVVNISNAKTANKFKYKYYIGEDELSYSETFTYLGVQISSDLNWNHQVYSVYSKAIRTLNFVKRNTSICSQKYKALAYLSLVRPHLEYASASWDPYYLKYSSQLEKVQNNAARFVYNNYSRDISVSSLKNELDWTSLEMRRKISRLVEFYKIVSGLSPISGSEILRAASSARAAEKGLFTNLYGRTNVYKFSFFPRCVRDWNELPLVIRTAPTIEHFRSDICKYFNTLSYHPSSSPHH